MWNINWRHQIWSGLAKKWDIVIIGGGITGAGIFCELSRRSYKVLLLEAKDFSSGTSSRSSKLVHGGFRYLKNGQISLTVKSVREREKLLSDARGLINPLPFLMACYKDDQLRPWMLEVGLSIYDLLACKWGHQFYSASDFLTLCPYISKDNLLGGFRFFDALTDDARLVFRIIKESSSDRAIAINYAQVIEFLHNQKGRICGVVIQDNSPFRQDTLEIEASLVINATGPWGDNIRELALHSRESSKNQKRLRLLRGSHLIFKRSKIPVTRAVSLAHPDDRRFVYAIPWEGVTLVGTTDVDHTQEITTNIPISDQEQYYLLKFVNHYFPGLDIRSCDIQSTFSGVRPVISTGKISPSKESREHAIWKESGLITITGGKLTTFRLMSDAVLKEVRKELSNIKIELSKPTHNTIPYEFTNTQIPRNTQLRLMGRYGNDVIEFMNYSNIDEFEYFPQSVTLLAEIRWAARAESIIHLNDLLLRRTRIGNIVPNGGIQYLDLVRNIIIDELKWDDNRWMDEVDNYTGTWEKYYQRVLE